MDSPFDFLFSSLPSYVSMSFDPLLSNGGSPLDSDKTPILGLDSFSPITPMFSSADEPVQFLESVELVKTVADALPSLAATSIPSIRPSIQPERISRKRRVQYAQETRSERWTAEKLTLLKKDVKDLKISSLPHYIEPDENNWSITSLCKEHGFAFKVVRDRWVEIESDKIDNMKFRDNLINQEEFNYLKSHKDSILERNRKSRRERPEKVNIWGNISKMLYQFHGSDKYIPASRIKNLYNYTNRKMDRSSKKVSTIHRRFVMLIDEIQDELSV